MNTPSDQQPTSPTTTLNQRLDIDFALNAVGLGIWEVDQITNQVIWDTRCQTLFGIAGGNSIPYEQAIQHIHPDDLDRVNKAVQWAINPLSGGIYDQTYRTIGMDDGLLRWVRFQGKAYFTPDGKVVRFAGIAQEVTQQVLARRTADESELKLRSVIEQAPAAIAISMLVGHDLIITAPNQTFMDTVGKGNEIAGKSLRDVMPELESQPFLQIFDQIFQSGQPFQSYDMPVYIIQQGQPKNYFFNVTFSPVRDQNDQIYAILGLSFDVTQQVLDRRAMQEQAALFQNAVDTAELGVWVVDIASGQAHLSERYAAMVGVSTSATFKETIERVVPAERDYAASTFQTAVQPGSNGKYDAEYTISHGVTGQKHIIRATGQVFFDAQGQPVRLEGTSQDITLQRAAQLALETQVRQRTQELMASNQELVELNQLLTRSNDNLQKFAYIASHDLQEPLRKIQQFSSLLSTNLTDLVSKEDLRHLERIHQSALRMATLIKDLLKFSRIATQRNTDEPVSLNELMVTVQDTLDLTISEANAQLLVDSLPIVSGDAVQLGQLFQNLLSNAVKFRQVGQVPIIHISSQTLEADQLPPTVNPSRQAPWYHRIDVRDNGMGFDEKYLDRIFQVFQRLHGRDEFTGTGIGLAICEKVVANHGGVITATSQPGQGATFMVYLPTL